MNGIEEALEARSTIELQRILKRLKQDLILGMLCCEVLVMLWCPSIKLSIFDPFWV